MNVSFILLAYFALFTLGLIDNSRGPIYPEVLNQFQILKSQGSIVFSLSSLMAFLMAIISKFWLRRWGAVTSTKISILLHFVATVLMGIAGRTSSGFPLFVIASLIFGIGVGVQSISLNMIIANAVNIEKRQKYFAGLHSMYGLASFIAPVLMSSVYHFNFSWQNYLMFLSIIPLALFFASLQIKTGETKITSESKVPVNKKLALKLGVLFSFYVSTEVMISSRLVVYLNEVWKYELDRASSLLSIFFLLLLLGRVLFIFVPNKVDSKILLKSSAFITILFLLIGMNFNPIFLALAGGSMSFFFPCAMSWISIKYHDQAESLISIVMTCVGGMIVTMHGTFGVISDIWGLSAAFSMGLILMFFVLYLLQTHK
jgi:fucose permease